MGLEVAPVIVLHRILPPIRDADRALGPARVAHAQLVYAANALEEVLEGAGFDTGAWGRRESQGGAGRSGS